MYGPDKIKISEIDLGAIYNRGTMIVRMKMGTKMYKWPTMKTDKKVIK